MKKYWAALLVVCGALVAGVLLLALVGYAPPASLLPTTTRGLVTTLEGHEKAILDVAFSGDGLMLASGSADTSARLWNVATGKQIAVIRGHPATVYAVAFSPDDEFLASVSGLVWAPAPPLRFGESDAAPTPTQIPDVLMSSSNGVILWQLATNTVKTYWGFGTPMFAAAFAPDGAVLATGNGNPMENIQGSVRLWNLSDSKLNATLWEGSHATVWSVAFSPDGKLLASGNTKGITVWDMETYEKKVFLAQDATGAVVFAPDGLLLAAGDASGVVSLWSTATYQVQATLEGHDAAVSDLAFNLDGSILASAGQDGRVYIWEVEAANKMATIRISRTPIGAIDFSPDGTLLATASSDGLIRLWNVEEVLEQ